ncbi:exonuclease domain-containing protein [Sporosarcina jeotgali]|uniref:Exonuclease domain-containing protein n=1 Tax=Sporosarcina jeotgali TaxID=3020056 RepID=A0ABZ0KZD9_9BACL|nr:exonuclease domain-containing protein [Sporosarcina sp. B2O-1]WOV84702.1 exonuclease domain-containing protein [Sporosarcina sp. B2O-1]
MDIHEKAIRLLQEKAEQPNRSRKTTAQKYKKSTKPVTDYVVLDFETTGLRAGADKIIQIGAIRYFNHWKDEEMDALINPQRYISPTITRITGISNEMVEEAPTIDEKIEELIEFIGELPIIAHNASFDMGFLYALEGLNGVSIPEYTVIDTVKIARQKIKDTPNHKLTTLTQYLQLEHDAHNAIGDCLATAAIYQYCTK